MIKIVVKGLFIILFLYILYVVIIVVVFFYVFLKKGEEMILIKLVSFFGYREFMDWVRFFEDGYEVGRVCI